MKQSIRIGLLLVVLSAILLAAGSTGALAGECMSLGGVGTQCGCETFCY